MSPQRSNRAQLIDGTLRCLERLPPERVTARVIARESGANVASITYHFGTKDRLVTEAAIAGLDRWLAEVAEALDAVESAATPRERFRQALEAVEAATRRYQGLAANYLAALGRGQHDEQVKETLADGFRRSRPEVAALLGLGEDQVGRDAAGLVLGLFHGLLMQSLLDPELAIEGNRMRQAQVRLRGLLPEPRG